MKDRKKRNIAIGLLCCLLVFMGVGFAAMNAMLKIEGTSTAINTWDVRMTKIEVIKTEGGASNNQELTKIDASGITAKFNSVFTKPGDSITYKITVENNGSIDAVLKDIRTALNVSEDDKHLFNVTNTLPNNELLVAGESTTFTVKVEFRSDADDLPNGTIEYTVKIDYIQKTDVIIDGEEETEKDWVVAVNDSGEIIAYNYAKGPNAVVPAMVNGIPVRKITPNSFLYRNLDYYEDTNTGQVHAVIYDFGDNYDIVKNKALNALAFDTCGSTACISQIESVLTIYEPGKYTFPNGITGKYYVNPDPDVDLGNSMFEGGLPRILSLDLSDAIYLETIESYSLLHTTNESDVRLETLVFPKRGNLTIGSYAFADNSISQLVITPAVREIGNCAFFNTYSINSKKLQSVIFEENSTLVKIGESAFVTNEIKGNLVIPDTVVEIGEAAFMANHLNSVIIPGSVTKIGSSAFSWQKDLNNNPTLQSVTVKRLKDDFLTNVTLGNEWFDNSLITEPIYISN